MQSVHIPRYFNTLDMYLDFIPKSLKFDVAKALSNSLNIALSGCINAIKASDSVYVDLMQNLLYELEKREKCSRNIIVYGIPKSSTATQVYRISCDMQSLSDAIQLFFTFLPANIKSIMFEKSTGRGHRPLKVFFSFKNLALKLISDFNTGMRICFYSDISWTIFISRDRTRIECEAIR